MGEALSSVFAGNYQRSLTYSPQKSWAGEGLVEQKAASRPVFSRVVNWLTVGNGSNGTT